MRRPSTITPPVGRFADVLLAIELPALPDDRRERTKDFVEQRVSTLPSFTRFGVVVISFADRVSGDSKMNRSIIFESFRLVTLWGLQDMLSLKRRQRAYRIPSSKPSSR